MSSRNLKHQWSSKNLATLAGRWLRPDGTSFCDWLWHTEQRELSIAAEGIDDRMNFELGKQRLQLHELMAVLPDISRQRVERITRNRPKMSELGT